MVVGCPKEMSSDEGRTKGVTPKEVVVVGRTNAVASEESRTEGVAPEELVVVVSPEEMAPEEGRMEEVAPEEVMVVGRTKAVALEEGRTEGVALEEVVVVGSPEEMVVPKVVGKRVRFPSQYVVSPFTAEVKRRTFVDGTYLNLFWEVDAAKWKAFKTEWRIIKSRHSRIVGERTISDAYKWFHDITTFGSWLADDYIDLTMKLLRDRVRRYSRSFDMPGRLILSTEFFGAVTIEHQSLQRMGSKYMLPYIWPNGS
ncbi:unnamed protein product [Fraxinus pennsylvanica]|uniref:Uncharacterized protein n=1 Tax=Fraxinus pennsylvanica TaxID=56036 RepID=A0AAD1ZNN0_9LAMI|nr:unnamed protein product [Fraxinus pennsylvanica]